MSNPQNIVYPPTDGALLLSDAPDFHLEHNPSLTFYVSTTSESDHTLVEITALEFVRAAHRLAHAVRPVGSDLQAGQVVGFVAITDTLMYQTVTMGIILAGLVPFPISPRLSAAAVAGLLAQSGATHLITTPSSLSSLIHEVQAIHEVTTLNVPEFSHVYPHFGHESSVHDFSPYPKQRRGADETTLYLHSSGSTGLPKAIRHTHLGITLWGGLGVLMNIKSYDPPVRMGTMSLPPFHTMGLVEQLIIPLYICRTAALYPTVFCTGLASSPVTPSPSNMLQHMMLTNSTATAVPPTTLQTWSLEQSTVDFLKTLQFVGVGGGPLVPETGDYLWSSGVNITSLYGTTETGTDGATPHDLYKRGHPETVDGQPARLWSYLGFSDATSHRWVPQGDGAFELVFLTSPTHKPAVLNYGNKEGYSTSDLYSPHPTIPDLWRFLGRKDDVIIHATGEKTVPMPFEDSVCASPLVAGAVMFGEARDQAGVLIELRDHVEGGPQELEELLWPVVAKANASIAAFSRVFKEMMLFTVPDRPLPRTAKGSVSRKVAIQLYHDEIDELYKTAAIARNSTSGIPALTLAELSDSGLVETWLRAHIGEIEPDIQINAKQDLFEQGLDSLSAISLRNRIFSAISPLDQLGASKITQNIVYDYPTLELLSRYLSSLLSDTSADPALHQSASIADLLSKYLPEPRSEEKETVLLTGSTGALGSNILAQLLQNERVKHVWAMNRGKLTEMTKRQHKAFCDQGLDLTLLDGGKVTFVSGNIHKRDLGLGESLFDEIQRTTTSIIHNAWRLDFNLSLASFEPYLASTKNLISFAHSQRSKIYFSSSISAAQGWDRARGPVPEDLLKNRDFSFGLGYGASKYVAEHMVARSGLPGCSFRIGQICGGNASGAWSTTDWFPILVKTSISLGMLPDAPGVVSWVPMDHVAARMVETVLDDKPHSSPVLNVVHPDPVPWTLVVASVSDVLLEDGITSHKLPLRPFSEWFAALEKEAQTTSALNDLPAAKMMGFYHQFALNSELPIQDTEESLGSPCFATSAGASLPAQIGKADVRKWVGFWKLQGFV